MNFRKIPSQNRSYAHSEHRGAAVHTCARAHIPRGMYKKKRGDEREKERETEFKTVRRAGKPANFPNFANKLSDVKIPRWIVKVLTSSATSQFSCLLPPPLYPVCTVQQSPSSRKRDAKRTARGGDEDQRGLRWCKSTLVLYLPGVGREPSSLRESGRSATQGKSSRK